MEQYQSWDEEVANNYVVKYGTPDNPIGRQKIRMEAAAKLTDIDFYGSLMDIPCGIGHLYPYVWHKVDYLGVDASEYMLNIARKQFPEAYFIKGDIYNLESMTMRHWGRPDIIVCLSFFEHIPEPFKILKKIYEAIRIKAIIHVQISDKPKVSYIPRKDKHLIARSESMRTVETWFEVLKIDNYEIHKITDATVYFVLYKY